MSPTDWFQRMEMFYLVVFTMAHARPAGKR